MAFKRKGVAALRDDRDRMDIEIDLLARRLLDVVDWLGTQAHTAGLRFGLFGASTGAAAARQVAAQRARSVGAVVSRGGRPDLALAWLDRVRAPTLLIVGGLDPEVRVLNEQAASHLHGVCELRIVAGATHLFEQPGALDEVAHLASAWFSAHLQLPPR
jgi:dienelactone hydrolase